MIASAGATGPLSDVFMKFMLAANPPRSETQDFPARIRLDPETVIGQMRDKVQNVE